MRSELRAAKESGLTWRVIWGTLREEGYPGGYQQFCKAANRVIEGTHRRSQEKRKNLRPPVVEKEVHQPKVRESGLSAKTQRKRRNRHGKYREKRQWRDWIAKRN